MVISLCFFVNFEIKALDWSDKERTCTHTNSQLSKLYFNVVKVFNEWGWLQSSLKRAAEEEDVALGLASTNITSISNITEPYSMFLEFMYLIYGDQDNTLIALLHEFTFTWTASASFPSDSCTISRLHLNLRLKSYFLRPGESELTKQGKIAYHGEGC